MHGKMPYLRAGLVGIGLLLVLTVVSGCAKRVPTAPLAEQERVQALAVPDGKALVHVYRITLAPASRNYHVIVNGALVGELSSDQYYVIEVPPGVVTIQSKMGRGRKWLRLNLDLAAGEQRYVDIGYRITGFYLLFTTTRFEIKEVSAEEGKAALRECELIRYVTL